MPMQTRSRARKRKLTDVYQDSTCDKQNDEVESNLPTQQPANGESQQSASPHKKRRRIKKKPEAKADTTQQQTNTTKTKTKTTTKSKSLSKSSVSKSRSKSKSTTTTKSDTKTKTKAKVKSKVKAKTKPSDKKGKKNKNDNAKQSTKLKKNNCKSGKKAKLKQTTLTYNPHEKSKIKRLLINTNKNDKSDKSDKNKEKNRKKDNKNKKKGSTPAIGNTKPPRRSNRLAAKRAQNENENENEIGNEKKDNKGNGMVGLDNSYDTVGESDGNDNGNNNIIGNGCKKICKRNLSILKEHGGNGEFQDITIDASKLNEQLIYQSYNRLSHYLFDYSCIYSFLEVFHIAYDIIDENKIQFKKNCNSNDNNNQCDDGIVIKTEKANDETQYIVGNESNVNEYDRKQRRSKKDKNKNKEKGKENEENDKSRFKYGLWYWLFMFEKFAIMNKRYRILILPVKGECVIEVRIDSLHGMPSGLLNQLIENKYCFEYYYAYSRCNYWGGWRFYFNGSLVKYHEYGYIENSNNNRSSHSGNTSINNNNINNRGVLYMPTNEWKNVIWVKQMETELISNKFGTNMGHLMQEYQRQCEFIEQYKNMNSGVYDNKDMDFYSYYMSQVLDQNWWKKHLFKIENNKLNKDRDCNKDNCLKMSHSDVSKMLGTNLAMICAQCGQTEVLCNALNLCGQFKGYFKFRDLYDRHQALVLQSYLS